MSGGCFFFTITLRDRDATLLVDYVDELRQSFREMSRVKPVTVDAMVVLPEHIHAVMTLPEGDDDYPTRLRMLKGNFTRRLKKRGLTLPKDSRGEHQVWQRRYWEHCIRDEADYRRHIDYVHYNPVKHGWVTQVKDWPFSSFHRFVKEGEMDEDWAGMDEVIERDFGEG